MQVLDGVNERFVMFAGASCLRLSLMRLVSLLMTVAGVFSFALAGCRRETQITPVGAEHIEATISHEGAIFHLVDDGNAYREVNDGAAWVYHDTVYDPEELAAAYRTEDGQRFRYDRETDRQFAIRNEFSESFEDLQTGVMGLKTLLSETRLLWGSITLQSPRAPDVAAYVALRQNILAGKSSFLDARLEPTEEHASAGKISIKCVAPARTDEMITCKASISTPLVCFRNGEDFWFQGDYWFEEGWPLTIADLECEFVKEHPGIRIRLYEDGVLGAELKALHKPQYRQPEGKQTRVPRRQWVTIRVHLHLSPTDGRIEIWQNGSLVLDQTGPTFPFRSAIYSSLEVGATAFSEPQGQCVLYMDNLQVATDESSLVRSPDDQLPDVRLPE